MPRMTIYCARNGDTAVRAEVRDLGAAHNGARRVFQPSQSALGASLARVGAAARQRRERTEHSPAPATARREGTARRSPATRRAETSERII
jgi:hypothetical protein